MTLIEILSINLMGRNIAIVGFPASGKSYLATQLAKNGNHKLIRTDDFIDAGYEQSMYLALEAIKDNIGHSICEGVQCYRLLRKCLEMDYKWPDVIIECERPRSKRDETYRNERDTKKLKYQHTFAISLQKIYNDYLMALPKDKRPELLVWDNDF